MTIKTADTNKSKNINLNNDSNDIATSNISKQELTSSSIDIKNITNSNYVNVSSTSSIARSLLSNNFNFSDSVQNHLDNINNYDIQFGNINKIKENKIKNRNTISTNIILNGEIQNENGFINKNNIYSNLFTSTSASNSSSLASYLALNQVQPKSKVNIINSSFNNIFGSIQFNDLEKNNIKENIPMIIKKSNNDEIDSIEEKKLFDNKDHANSSSNLMFGSLNILKTCKLPNNKSNKNNNNK